MTGRMEMEENKYHKEGIMLMSRVLRMNIPIQILPQYQKKWTEQNVMKNAARLGISHIWIQQGAESEKVPIIL